MGRKRVSKIKRKQAKAKSAHVSKGNNGRSSASDARPVETQPAQVNEKVKAFLPLLRGGMNPSAGSKKDHKKR